MQHRPTLSHDSLHCLILLLALSTVEEEFRSKFENFVLSDFFLYPWSRAAEHIKLNTEPLGSPPCTDYFAFVFPFVVFIRLFKSPIMSVRSIAFAEARSRQNVLDQLCTLFGHRLMLWMEVVAFTASS
jgi:hypothetical protein